MAHIYFLVLTISNLTVIDNNSPYNHRQASPIFKSGHTVNENILKSSNGGQDAFQSFLSGSVVMGRFLTSEKGDIQSMDPKTAFFALLLSTTEQASVEYQGDPMSQIFLPIFDSFEDDREPVAVMVACKSV